MGCKTSSSAGRDFPKWEKRYTWAELAPASFERLQAILASLAKVWSHGESCTLAFCVFFDLKTAVQKWIFFSARLFFAVFVIWPPDPLRRRNSCR